jgi:hypothetical protein
VLAPPLFANQLNPLLFPDMTPDAIPASFFALKPISILSWMGRVFSCQNAAMEGGKKNCDLWFL